MSIGVRLRIAHAIIQIGFFQSVTFPCDWAIIIDVSTTQHD